MSSTIKLDIPDAATRARQNVLREILQELISHSLNIDQATRAIEHLIKADADTVHATGRTRAGNDIGGI